jgi:hypothetical protein
MHADDVRLLGIPRSRPIIAMINPQHGLFCMISRLSQGRFLRATNHTQNDKTR